MKIALLPITIAFLKIDLIFVCVGIQNKLARDGKIQYISITAVGCALNKNKNII